MRGVWYGDHTGLYSRYMQGHSRPTPPPPMLPVCAPACLHACCRHGTRACSARLLCRRCSPCSACRGHCNKKDTPLEEHVCGGVAQAALELGSQRPGQLGSSVYGAEALPQPERRASERGGPTPHGAWVASADFDGALGATPVLLCAALPPGRRRPLLAQAGEARLPL